MSVPNTHRVGDSVQVLLRRPERLLPGWESGEVVNCSAHGCSVLLDAFLHQGPVLFPLYNVRAHGQTSLGVVEEAPRSRIDFLQGSLSRFSTGLESIGRGIIAHLPGAEFLKTTVFDPDAEARARQFPRRVLPALHRGVSTGVPVVAPRTLVQTPPAEQGFAKRLTVSPLKVSPWEIPGIFDALRYIDV